MKYIIVTILLVLTQRADAISINFGSGTYSNSKVPDGALGFSNPVDSSIGYSFAGDSASIASWSLFNSPDQLISAGSQVILGSGSTKAVIDFKLNETVSYSFDALERFWLEDGGSFSTLFSLGNPNFLSFTPPVFNERQTATESGFMQWASSGILYPGVYWFILESSLQDGFSTGSYTLTLNHVPDGGSALMLLGMALAALGIYKHKAI